ncbi:MAG: hypothetical protein QOI99_2088 [Actinomycetota bacterium]|jgi:hypothetical protein|nr:hypothetical protein [Actinomycetota bacterium]
MRVVGVRPALLVAIAAGAAFVVATAVVRQGEPVRGSGPTATVGRAAIPSPAPAAVPAPTTTVAVVPDATTTAEATGSDTLAYLGADDGPGLVITSNGSATVVVGGNVVSGVPAGGPASIVTGDATAVGNTSTVRAP